MGRRVAPMSRSNSTDLSPLLPDRRTLDRARVSRDPRFDGRAPREIRRGRREGRETAKVDGAQEVVLHLAYRPPYAPGG